MQQSSKVLSHVGTYSQVRRSWAALRRVARFVSPGLRLNIWQSSIVLTALEYVARFDSSDLRWNLSECDGHERHWDVRQGSRVLSCIETYDMAKFDSLDLHSKGIREFDGPETTWIISQSSTVLNCSEMHSTILESWTAWKVNKLKKSWTALKQWPSSIILNCITHVVTLESPGLHHSKVEPVANFDSPELHRSK